MGFGKGAANPSFEVGSGLGKVDDRALSEASGQEDQKNIMATPSWGNWPTWGIHVEVGKRKAYKLAELGNSAYRWKVRRVGELGLQGGKVGGDDGVNTVPWWILAAGATQVALETAVTVGVRAPGRMGLRPLHPTDQIRGEAGSPYARQKRRSYSVLWQITVRSKSQ